MSRHSSHEQAVSNGTEALEIIREEQGSPSASVTMNTVKASETEVGQEQEDKTIVVICPCKDILDEEHQKQNAEEVERLLKQKEEEMEKEFQKRLEKEMKFVKDRFEFILRNEQVRSSCMLREAHRERKEKISALKTQLECKNLAGLMYVLCSERRQHKLEELRRTEEYTKYIQSLQELLAESQSLILNLSRGYKTAARVDYEWKGKMKKVISEFQKFVYNFTGGKPDVNQYFFDLPNLLKIDASVHDDPKEDPCENEETPIVQELPPNKTWWEELNSECRPFVVFGDMADFQPPQRREVLKAVKAAKTAPKKWKEYAFNDMFMKEKCENLDSIKHEYLKHQPSPAQWECQMHVNPGHSRGSETSRRVTTASVDIRGTMGSILKIISASTPQTHAPARATLLGARDSMEIASTTRLREKHHHDSGQGKVVLNIGDKIGSLLNKITDNMEEETDDVELGPKETTSKVEDEEVPDELSALGSIHNDSLLVIPSHVPDLDHKINYEKTCPVEKCQNMHVDEFTRSLPPYMRASPYTHFEQTYDDYEACTPEQLEILKHRLEEKKKKEKVDFHAEADPLSEWTPSVEGIGIQTSDISMSIPPCTCQGPSPTPVSSNSRQVFTMLDLIPLKQKLDRINQECFYNDGIEFNRFQVIGQESAANVKCEEEDFSKNRLQDLKRILQQHPSMCEVFQGNIRC